MVFSNSIMILFNSIQSVTFVILFNSIQDKQRLAVEVPLMCGLKPNGYFTVRVHMYSWKVVLKVMSHIILMYSEKMFTLTLGCVLFIGMRVIYNQRRVQPDQCYFTVQITGRNFECSL